MGLPDLEPHLQARVDHGNALLKATVQLIRACVSQRVPWILENPGISCAFKTPVLQEFLRLGWCREMVCDQCQHGTRWRKRTTFFVENICVDDCGRLCKQCTAHRGHGSRTGKAHWHLS
eukprot:8605526-Pyramimonas_sp.AAC.1